MALATQLEILYRLYRQELYTYALAVAQCPAAAEDAVHTAFANMLALRQMPHDPKAYVFRTVRNAAIDCRRAKERLVSASRVNVDNSIFDVHLQDLENAETAQAVADAMQTLSDEEREVIVAHLHAALTFREIADVLDRPLGTVVSWYRRGLDNLRKEVEVTDG